MEGSEKQHYSRSFANRSTVELSEYVGCFYCLRVGSPDSMVGNYMKDKKGDTAVCKCGIDSVVPYNELLDGSIDDFKEYLKECYQYSFVDNTKTFNEIKQEE